MNTYTCLYACGLKAFEHFALSKFLSSPVFKLSSVFDMHIFAFFFKIKDFSSLCILPGVVVRFY